MNVDLEKLNTAVEFLVNQKTFLETVEHLSIEINHSPEAFVWSVIDLSSIERELPEGIRSSWIFVLKKDAWTGCHYHPNSVQHMVTIKGQGMSKVAGESKRMVQFGSANDSLADKWFVIGEGVPHEFFPEKENMVVVSFHTCEASELEEVDCETSEKRVYEREI
jgi:mannose-6-phosphate isomerase-like protein (cupin superfamily)